MLEMQLLTMLPQKCHMAAKGEKKNGSANCLVTAKEV